jgi:predicted nucleic acid-binding protein
VTERCVDASVAIKWAVQESLREEALTLLHDSLANGVTLIAPALFSVEVDSVIRKQAHQGLLSPEQETTAYALLDTIAVRVVETAGVRQRAREIARQLGQRSVYDSLYAALAESRNCEFWTADEEFYKRARRSLPFVRSLADYAVPAPST